MEPFLGQIFLVGFNFAPRGFAFCNGQILPISQNTALFSLLGTTYGGDGRATFALPDLRGRAPIHFGQAPGLSLYELGEAAGTEATTLTLPQLPAHTHSFNLQASTLVGNAATPAPTTFLAKSSSGAGNYRNSANTTLGGGLIGVTGNNLPVDIRQPFLVLNYIIALVGIFPSRG